MNDQQLNLTERFKRYNEKALADEKTSFCREKQELDMEVLRGKPASEIQKMASPVKGQALYFDPLNSQLHTVKQRRKELEEENRIRWKSKEFQNSIADIPKVAYHPSTLLTQLQAGQVTIKQIGRLSKQKPDLWENGFFSPDRDEGAFIDNKGQDGIPLSPQRTTSQAMSPQYDVVGNLLPEVMLQKAMLKAKSGDKQALYNLFMSENAPRYEPQLSSLIREGSLANSDFRFIADRGIVAVSSAAGTIGSEPLQLMNPIDCDQNSIPRDHLNAVGEKQTGLKVDVQLPILAANVAETIDSVDNIDPAIASAFFKDDRNGEFRELTLNEPGDDERSIDNEKSRSPTRKR